jgi:glutathione S-transferase
MTATNPEASPAAPASGALTIHHLGLSQSERIIWLCEELELPYDLVRHDRDPVMRNAPASYRALHPSGTAPIITDGDLVLAETGAIVDYILALHGDGRLAPAPHDPDFANYLYWLHFANGSLMPALMLQMAVNILAPGEDTMATRAFSERAGRGLAMVEERLAAARFFAGDRFTVADIMMGFPLTTMRRFVAIDLSPFPHTRAYLERIAARPAYRRMAEKAEPEELRP